jgi:hypothetical protein
VAVTAQAAASFLQCFFFAHGIFNAFKIIFACPGFFFTQIDPAARELVI